jgi:hypothetical protein
VHGTSPESCLGNLARTAATGKRLDGRSKAIIIAAMARIGRLALALLAALASYVVVDVFAGALPGAAVATAVGIGLWLGSASRHPLVRGALLGAGWGGVIGFAGGFFGPMLLAPDANQGPMLGLFITGPGGVVLGGLAGLAIAAGKPG